MTIQRCEYYLVPRPCNWGMLCVRRWMPCRRYTKYKSREPKTEAEVLARISCCLWVSPGSLIVPDFTISLYGSSCKYVLFSLILATFLSFSLYWHPKIGMGSQEIDSKRKEERITPKRENCMNCMNCCTQKLSNPGLWSYCIYTLSSLP